MKTKIFYPLFLLALMVVEKLKLQYFGHLM